MIEILIKCPRSRRAVSTGITLPKATWNKQGRFSAFTKCEVCGVDHEWGNEDVWLAIPGSAVADSSPSTGNPPASPRGPDASHVGGLSGVVCK